MHRDRWEQPPSPRRRTPLQLMIAAFSRFGYARKVQNRMISSNRSWSSLSLCFTTTIHKSNDLPPKSQDPRKIVETSQKMCIQASKSRDGVNRSWIMNWPVWCLELNRTRMDISMKYPSSSCPARDIKHVNKRDRNLSWSLLIGRFPSLLHTFSAWKFCGRISSKAL